MSNKEAGAALTMSSLANRHNLIALLSFGLAIFVAGLIYSLALGGTFLLDDQFNLDGLKHIDDLRSALQFVTSGQAGPLGRPLALASFLPQASQMEVGARAFLLVNTGLHLLNGCLVAWFLYRLCIAQRTEQKGALFIAITAAAIWLFMPLLASATLMVVQRMTTLSATFMLLGLIGYLHARAIIDTRPNTALTGMSIALGVGTLLAVLTKENGALLPTLVLALEATVLSRPSVIDANKWRTWALVFLVLPTLLIVGYLLTSVPYAEELVLRRDFTGWERFITQCQILWEYLFNAFVPQPAQFGPFHDDYPVSRSILDPVTFAAVATWLTALGLALAWRRRYPVFALAVFWFLGGHLVESTVLPLELYFEHRNYIPIIGPVFAICFVTARLAIAKRRIVYLGLPAYALVHAISLASVTSLWGDPAVAAHFWHERHPDSVRAMMTFAGHQLKLEGPHLSRETMREFTRRNPNAGYVKIQEFNLDCVLSPQQDHRQAAAALEESLLVSDFSYTTGTVISNLVTTVSQTPCTGIDLPAVKSIADAVLQNPRYDGSDAYKQLHYQIMAEISKLQGKPDQAIRNLELAIEHKPTPDLNDRMVLTYAADGRFNEARQFIEASRADAPVHPLKRYAWLSRLEDLNQYIAALEQQPARIQQPQ